MKNPSLTALALALIAFVISTGIATAQTATTAPQWQEVELAFTASRTAANPYTDTEAWAEFTHDDGAKIRRPMFWDGGRTFRVRFASNRRSGNWRWQSNSADQDPGLHGRTGTLTAVSGRNSAEATTFERHGFWSIPTGGRNLIHADGTPRLLCADTPWALPWRATVEQVEIYARDRKAKGFNAALLMTVQPDMKATGPRSRTEDLGFDEIKTLHSLATPFWKFMLQVSFFTGMRMGDAVTLQRANVDFAQSRIRFVSRKTGKTTIVPLHTKLREIFAEFPRGKPEDYYWPEEAARYVSAGASAFSQEFYELMAKSGIVKARDPQKLGSGKGRAAKREQTPIGFHNLRHTFVSMLKLSGANDSIAKELAGHRSDAVSGSGHPSTWLHLLRQSSAPRWRLFRLPRRAIQ